MAKQTSPYTFIITGIVLIFVAILLMYGKFNLSFALISPYLPTIIAIVLLGFVIGIIVLRASKGGAGITMAEMIFIFVLLIVVGIFTISWSGIGDAIGITKDGQWRFPIATWIWDSTLGKIF